MVAYDKQLLLILIIITVLVLYRKFLSLINFRRYEQNFPIYGNTGTQKENCLHTGIAAPDCSYYSSLNHCGHSSLTAA